MKKAVFNWSGGKDSALALKKALESKEYDIIALLTSINSETKESSMHHIPTSLLQKQAAAIGIELYTVDLAPHGDMDDYTNSISLAVEHFKSIGVTHFVFGDIHLKDVINYREKQLSPLGIIVVEPLWGMSTTEVMDDFIASGLKNIVVTVDANSLDESCIGKKIDRNFIDSLPASVDICGENGEYHTFCYGGDIFSNDINFKIGKPKKVDYSINMEDGTIESYSYIYGTLC